MLFSFCILRPVARPQSLRAPFTQDHATDAVTGCNFTFAAHISATPAYTFYFRFWNALPFRLEKAVLVLWCRTAPPPLPHSSFDRCTNTSPFAFSRAIFRPAPGSSQADDLHQSDF